MYAQLQSEGFQDDGRTDPDIWMRFMDGTCTRMLRKTLTVSWRNHMTNQELHGSLPRITTIVRQRRLRLVGHVMHHDEVAKHSPALEARWPSEKPTATRQNVIENDTKHSGTILLIAMKNRKDRKEIITSPR